MLSDRSDDSIFLCDLSTRTKILIDDSIRDFALSPDGLSVIFSYQYDKNIHISDIPRLHPVTFTSLSPDAEIFVCILSDRSVWFESPVVSTKLDGKIGSVKHLTFSSSNSLLAAVDENSLMGCLFTETLQECIF